jgi:hypothetical protein
MPDRISWTIDDKPVQIGGWSADMSAHGGFRDFRGTAVGNILFAEQEAPVAGYRRNGDVFWYGTMVTDPEITEGGAAITAEGLFKQDFATKSGRRFFLSRDLGLWADQHEAPYLFAPLTGETFAQSVTEAALVWTIDKGVDVIIGDETGWCAWIDGTVLTNFSCDLSLMPGVIAAEANRQHYMIETGEGPDDFGGTTVQENGDIDPTDTRIDIPLEDTSGDLCRIRVYREVWTAAANKVEGYLSNVELRGIANASVYTATQVLQLILTLDDRPAQIAGSGQDVMPLDFTGTDYDLARYVTGLVDWWFMIEHKDRFGTLTRSGPWEDVITVARKSNARTALVPLRRYNSVRVPYKTTTDVEQFATARANPDPFPEKTVEFLAEALEDAQADATAATLVAETLVRRYSAIRRSGNVLIAQASFEGKTLSPYEIRPGVLVDLSDHEPALPPQRLEAVTWNAEGVVSGSIEAEGSAASTLKASASAPSGPRNRGAR